MSRFDHIGSTLGSSSPSQESGTSSKVRKCSWWMPNLTFSILKIERRVIHQIVCISKDKSIGVLKITYGHHPPCIRKAISGTFLSRSTLAPVEIVSLYLKAGWRNQPQSFSTWKVRSETSHWIHLGFPISIPGVRNVLQSQEVFLMDAKSNFFKEKSIGVLKITKST